MERVVSGEWLDRLPVDDGRAVGSRRDLQRLNAWMGNARIVASELTTHSAGRTRRPIMDLGAGDGHFALQLARRLAPRWRGGSVVLVDKQPVDLSQLHQAFSVLGWTVTTSTTDVLENSAQVLSDGCHTVLANLFLHHFEFSQLKELLSQISREAHEFIAVEPRRSRFALAASRLVGLIGCNAVTRHDARVSVRAGFSGQELSRLWPNDSRWRLREHRAGCFSHLFVARRLPERETS